MPSHKVSRAFDWALRVEPDRREEFIGRIFPDDTSAARELRLLLESNDEAGEFLTSDAIRDARHLLQEARSPLDLEPGETVGDFVVHRLLGHGAFGKVYLATQVSLERPVAIKVTPNLGGEGRTMAQLDHSNIVRVYSETVIAERGIRVLCMPHVPGCDLARVLQARREQGVGRLDGKSFLELYGGGALLPLSDVSPLGLFVHLGIGLARALAYANRRGILHLDVKPGNILIDASGEPLLADFSVATRTDVGSQSIVGGTARYMAPEQRDGLDLDSRADLYALGVVLRELLPEDQLAALGEAGEAGARVLTRLTMSDRAKRYASAEEVEAALIGCARLETLQSALPPIPFAERFAKPILAVVTALPLATIALRNADRAVMPTIALLLGLIGLLFVRDRRKLLLYPSAMAALSTFVCVGESLLGFLVFLRGGAEDPGLFFPGVRFEIALSGILIGLGLVVGQWLALRVLFPRRWGLETDVLTRGRADLQFASIGLAALGFSALFGPLLLGFRMTVAPFGGKTFPILGACLLIFAGCLGLAVLGSYLLLYIVSRAFDGGPFSSRSH